MAHLHKKMKKGRPYYYVREIARVDGKPKVVNQIYLGSPERILENATKGESGISRIQVQEFGALWIADLIERDIGFAEIVDSVVPREVNETGPTVGEYFLYAVFNRMIDSRSKRSLAGWYKSTAIQQIRPVDIDSLSSQRFWKKWNRVTEKQLQDIAERFFAKVIQLEPPASDCFMFDTTNYYTFLASETDSELAQRGKNKAGRGWLRQVGLGLLVSRDNHLPLYYKEYEGNRHDSKLFLRVMDEVFGAMCAAVGNKKKMTVVFDKGMNSEENIAAIDENQHVSFITTYSTYFAEELIHVDRSSFSPVDTEKNRKLREQNFEDDQLIAWRTSGDYWGQERTVVVTYNPLTATKQRYNFEKKLLRLQDSLFEMQSKVTKQLPQWKNAKKVEGRYHEICSQLHMPSDLYKVELYSWDGRLRMNFRKNHYRIKRYIDRFGKNIIITDNMDWTTDEIVKASLDRYSVEQSFRQTKDDDLVSLMPLRHWTDGKIRCHILTCIVALTYLRILEIRLRRSGLTLSAQSAIDKMQRLHSCLTWTAKKRKPERIIEDPTDAQAQIVKAFGYKVKSGVLQVV